MDYLQGTIVAISVTAIVQAIKTLLCKNGNESYLNIIPLLSILIGILAQVAHRTFTTGFHIESIFEGVIIGTIAMGIYDTSSIKPLGK